MKFNTMFTKMQTVLAHAKLTSVALLIGVSVAGVVQAQTIESIKQKKTLVVGVQADQVPWGYIDANGQNAGYDVDVAKLMGADMGVNVEFVRVTVPNRIAQLVTGKVDVLAAVMGMYPDRAKVVQFSKPYSTVDILVYGKKQDNFTQVSDLIKYRVGVSRASAQDIALTKQALPGTSIQRFDDDSASMQALMSGQVDAIGGNNTYQLVIDKGVGPGKFEPKFRIARQFNGISTRLGQKEINEWMNAFIDRNLANGKLNAINKKWIGTDLPELAKEIPGIPFTVQ
jgi:polar amino acid transport system substrate-binding protein